MIRSKYRLLHLLIFGNPEKIATERYIVTSITFLVAVFLILLIVLHLILSLSFTAVTFAVIGVLLLVGYYLFVRLTNFYSIAKLLMTISGILMFDVLWYTDYMSNGPVLFFTFIYVGLVTWMWDGKWMIIFLCLFYIDLAFIGFVDANTPEALSDYPDHATKSIYLFLSLSALSILFVLLLYFIKAEYYRQKENVIKSDNLKSAFLANMSHEIRTPMNSIIGFSQLLEDETDSLIRGQYIKIILTNGENLLRLIDDIIDLSKIESGNLKITLSNVNINKLFSELNDLFLLELQKREKVNIRIEFSLPDENLYLTTDHLRLRQILSNLISNAVKFTSQGLIRISCEKNKQELLFRVSDTGVGILPENQPGIFDRFVRFDYHDMNREGSGIGLSIVQKLINLLHGRIWFDSLVGKGSNFYFSLPYIIDTNKYQLNNIMETDQQLKETKAKSLLLVEDVDSNALLIKESLRTLEIKIHHVNNGLDAIKFIEMNPETNLVLMDLKLPVMDGYEATRVIKKMNPNIKVIAQTAYAMVGDKEKAIESGCDDYLTKPIKIQSLQQLILRYISSS